MNITEQIRLDIGNFLGFVDLNGEEAVTSDEIEQLERILEKCVESAKEGVEIIPDAIYDRLYEILQHKAPDSELVKGIWENTGSTQLDDDDAIFKTNPMYSIQTIKSFDCKELNDYVNRLPEGFVFDAFVSVKLNGHGIRLVYNDGDFVKARSRARSSQGRDISKQLKVILAKNNLLHLEALEGSGLCEIRGELVLPFTNLDKAKQFYPDMKSAFSGVASMSRDSATEEEWGLLDFIAYEYLADGMTFGTKESEYEYLEDELGFAVPMNWLISNLSKETLIDEIKGIVDDCESYVTPDENGENGYDYYTDGLVFTINDTYKFRSLGDDGGHYKYGNIALKVGYWKQDLYSGFVQTILWTHGKSKESPVAIIAENKDTIQFTDMKNHKYITDKKEIANWDSLGVITASGNRVKRVPLYEPNNLIILDAYQGKVIHFRYGGEAGVIPCTEDGTPLSESKLRQVLENEDKEDNQEVNEDD